MSCFQMHSHSNQCCFEFALTTRYHRSTCLRSFIFNQLWLVSAHIFIYLRKHIEYVHADKILCSTLNHQFAGLLVLWFVIYVNSYICLISLIYIPKFPISITFCTMIVLLEMRLTINILQTCLPIVCLSMLNSNCEATIIFVGKVAIFKIIFYKLFIIINNNVAFIFIIMISDSLLFLSFFFCSTSPRILS